LQCEAGATRRLQTPARPSVAALSVGVGAETMAGGTAAAAVAALPRIPRGRLAYQPSYRVVTWPLSGIGMSTRARNSSGSTVSVPAVEPSDLSEREVTASVVRSERRDSGHHSARAGSRRHDRPVRPEPAVGDQQVQVWMPVGARAVRLQARDDADREFALAGQRADGHRDGAGGAPGQGSSGRRTGTCTKTLRRRIPRWQALAACTSCASLTRHRANCA